MRTAAAVDQLHIEADQLAGLLDTAFHHVAHVECGGDGAGVEVAVFEREGGFAGDHERIVHARQRRR